MVKMKDSGIEWIGEIPETWKVIPLYMCFTERRNKNRLGKEKNLLSLSYGHIVQKNIEAKGGLLPESFTTYNIIEPGDIIIRPTDLQNDKRSLRTGLSNEHGIITSAYIDLEPLKNVNSKYYHYLLHSYDIQKVFYNMGNGVRQGLNYSEFSKLRVLAPKSIEQQQIADYLDHKTTEIDGLIDKINAEIDTLQQYQSSVITQAVTKGLDPNVPMKDSGIEWIGEIPETWEVVPLYKYFSERKNKNRSGKEKNILSLSYGNIIRKDIEAKGGLLPESFTTYNIIEPGDIIIRPTDLQNDKRSLRTGLSNERGIITSAYIDLAPERGTNSRYYHYLLHSYDVQKVFYNMGNGVRQGLNYSEFSKLRVLIPERGEQQQIVDYLDKKVFQIQNIIKSKHQQINQLTEYKNSLIFEYVTGKKQVKEAN